jgi:hypothetical protein
MICFTVIAFLNSFILNSTFYQTQEIGVIDIYVSEIQIPIQINDVNVIDLVSSFNDESQLSAFGEIHSSNIEESIVGSTGTYIYQNVSVKVSRVLPEPQIIEIRILSSSSNLKLDQLELEVGSKIDTLSIGFQKIAKKYNVLPEFGVSNQNNKYSVNEGQTVIRIFYNLDTKVIEEVTFLNSPM